MPRVIFVNRFFYPDLSATSQLLTDLAFSLARADVEVIVVTGRYRYTDGSASLPKQEPVNGVRVVRVSTTRFGRARLGGRLVDYLSFYLTALVALFRVVRKGDVVVAETDPPLISVVTRMVTRIKRARQINWLQDLFPEVGLVLEPDLLTPRMAKWAKGLRDWSLRSAHLNVVLGELMMQRVLALGVPAGRIATIPNWSDDSAITPVEQGKNPLRAEWGLEGKFVVAYSGNLGRAHDFRTILEAAQLLKHRTDIVFLIIGEGAQIGTVRQLVAAYSLSNVVQQPYQPRDCLRFSLGVADLHLVSLIPHLEGLIVPSKFYGIAAAGRATLFIGDENGEIGRLLRQHECGRSFSVGESRGVADFIASLADDPQTCARWGLNARVALGREWSQAFALARWHDMVATLDKRTSA